MPKTFNDDEQQILSDRLENVGAVVSFLGEAACALCEREQPVTATDMFGMSLVFQCVKKDLEWVQCILLEDNRPV